MKFKGEDVYDAAYEAYGKRALSSAGNGSSAPG
jgi:hypothetical protein